MQVYISSENREEDRPLKLLKGFKRITVNANETENAIISIDLEDIKFYDPDRAEWKLDNSYTVLLGTSSKNAKSTGKIGF